MGNSLSTVRFPLAASKASSAISQSMELKEGQFRWRIGFVREQQVQLSVLLSSGHELCKNVVAARNEKIAHWSEEEEEKKQREA